MSSVIIIFCGECGTKIVTDTKHAGRAAICAECEAKVPIPRTPSDKPQLRLFCPGCKNRVSAALSKAGHAMVCPKCEEEIDLPRIKIGEQPKKKEPKRKEHAEWMPRGVKKKELPSKKDAAGSDELVPLKGADDEDEGDEEEDEILNLLRRMSGIERTADTDAVDVVEVLDDEEDSGAAGSKRPKAVDEKLQRAETQGMEPFPGRKGAAKKPPEKPKGGNFRFTCPECGFRILVSAANIGKKGRCPDCKEIVVIRKP